MLSVSYWLVGLPVVDIVFSTDLFRPMAAKGFDRVSPPLGHVPL
jgi:hypothetical protein